MNSNYGKSNTSSGSLNSFNFDLGLNSGRTRSLNEQKNNTSSSYTYTSTQQPRPSTGPSWTGQPNRPAWTHQPAGASAQPGRPGSLSGPTSMVGDIFGKSWSSSGPATGGDIGIGIAKKDPNLFSDLLTSSLGQNKVGSGNVPLKNAAPVGNKSAFSMGGMADSLPKTGNSVKSGGSWGSTENFGSFMGAYNVNKGSTSNVNLGGSNTKGPNLGGPSLNSMTGVGSGTGMNSNKDPFGNLVDFSAKPSGSMNVGSKANNKSSSTDDSFGEFKESTRTSESLFASNAFPAGNNGSSSMGSSTGGSYSNVDDFGVFNTQTQPSTQTPPPSQSSGINDFDALFTSATTSSGGATKGSDGLESQQFSGGDDWGIGPEFGGGDDTSGTTELDGLPPPPAGVSASAAKSKGMDNYKSGQYADAINWLSWAIILLEKAGDHAGTFDVLSSRASCYKEVGEYKKAVADCSKVLEHDGNNVAVLVQRALLYESMEKYKLGAEDLRTVMKLDPGNRVARSTIHRLTQMAG